MSPRCRRRAGFVLLPVVLLLGLVAAVAFIGHRETGLASASAGGTTDVDKARYAAEAGLHRAIVQMHSKGCGGTYPMFLLSPVQDSAFDGGKYYAYASPLSGSPATVYSTGTYGDTQITLTRSNVPMHQAATATMTLQPASEGIDTYLDSANAASNANKTTMIGQPGASFPLLRFDLSTLPAGGHVTAATLSAYATGGSNNDQVALHRVTRDWTEAATWATSDGTAAWSLAGGDVVSPAVASTAFAGAGTWLNWDVTALADRWLKGSLPNQGVQLRAGAAISGLQLASSDSATAAQRPKLSITFLPPCGWTPPDTTVRLNPVADVDVNKDAPGLNFGAYPDLYLSKGYEAHPLLKFDLAGIAPGKTVKSATLRLYFQALTINASKATKTSKSLTLNVHSVTKTWQELQATWLKRLTGSSWSTPGGDYTSTAAATKSLAQDSVPGVWLEFDIKTLTQEWVDGVTTNNGLLLVLPTSSTEEIIFSSREAASNPPELVVTYQ